MEALRPGPAPALVPWGRRAGMPDRKRGICVKLGGERGGGLGPKKFVYQNRRDRMFPMANLAFFPR